MEIEQSLDIPLRLVDKPVQVVMLEGAVDALVALKPQVL